MSPEMNAPLIIDLEKVSRVHHVNIPGARPPLWGIYPGAGYSWSGLKWVLTSDIPGIFEKWSGQQWRSEIGVVGSVLPPGTVAEHLRTMTVKEVTAGTIPDTSQEIVVGGGLMGMVTTWWNKIVSWFKSIF